MNSIVIVLLGLVMSLISLETRAECPNNVSSEPHIRVEMDNDCPIDIRYMKMNSNGPKFCTVGNKRFADAYCVSDQDPDSFTIYWVGQPNNPMFQVTGLPPHWLISAPMQINNRWCQEAKVPATELSGSLKYTITNADPVDYCEFDPRIIISRSGGSFRSTVRRILEEDPQAYEQQ